MTSNVLEDIERTREYLTKQKEEAEMKPKELAAVEIRAREQQKAIAETGQVINQKLGNLIDEDEFIHFFSKPWFMKEVPKKDHFSVKVLEE